MHPMSDVIVLLPGITGSVLKKEGKVVWGFSAGTIVKALFTGGNSMEKALALPDDDPDRDNLDDGIVADALMPDLHLIPGIWKIDGYGKIANEIKSNFDVVEGKNFFPFPYDWRRDNRVAARKLVTASHDWLKAWREKSGNKDAKLILIGHSMGGLVSRYFLECMEGWKNTKALITFGTPYRGSLNALDGLANGIKKGPLNLADLSRQFTALYQLLPIYECYDSGDGKLARVGETTGIPNVDPAKAKAALKFHREIEEAVTANQKLDEYNRSYRISPIVGISQQTLQSGKLVNGKVEMLETLNGKTLGGDGTVPRVSAIPIELSDDQHSAAYAGTKHASLQNSDAMLVNLTGLLTPQLGLGNLKKAERNVAVRVDDVFFKNEPIIVHTRPEKAGASVTASLWRNGERRQPVATVVSKSGDEWRTMEFAPQMPGVYQVTVGGEDLATAEDALIVAEGDNS